jgi:hypothetical protein
MARDRHGRVVLSEAAAFEKLQQAMKHAIEASTEIGVRRQDKRWAQMGMIFEKLNAQVSALYSRAQLDAVVGRSLN